MCTLVIRQDRRRALPLVVAANRDEVRARPTAPVERLFDTPVVAIGGRDLEQGGTWMGATDSGLFVGLTNQRTFDGPAPGRRSRGQVVLDALARGTVRGVDDLLADLDGRAHNGFNLLYGDGETLRVAYARSDRRAVDIETLADGLWVLPNDVVNSPAFPKAERALSLLGPLAEEDDWPTLRAGLVAILGDTELPPPDAIPALPPGSRWSPGVLRQLQALNIRAPFYGTRSATVAAVGPDRRVAHYLFADGPPDETAFEEQVHLLTA